MGINACGSHADLEVTVIRRRLLVSSSHSWYCLGSYVDFVAEGDGIHVGSNRNCSRRPIGDLSARYTVGSQVSVRCTRQLITGLQCAKQQGSMRMDFLFFDFHWRRWLAGEAVDLRPTSLRTAGILKEGLSTGSGRYSLGSNVRPRPLLGLFGR